MTDFELGIHNAFSKEFPGIEITGCSWHFGQAHIRWLSGKFYQCLLGGNFPS